MMRILINATNILSRKYFPCIMLIRPQRTKDSCYGIKLAEVADVRRQTGGGWQPTCIGRRELGAKLTHLMIVYKTIAGD
jgi:hypothetical protein